MSKYQRKGAVRPISIGQIVLDPRNQQINVATVSYWYGELKKNPNSYLPPIFLRRMDSGFYRIRDGHHRFIAALLANERKVDAYIEEKK